MRRAAKRVSPPAREPLEVREQAAAACRPVNRRRRAVEREGVDGHGVAPDQRHEAERGGEPRRLAQLAARRHRRRRVDEQPDGEVVLGLEQPQQELVEPGQSW